MSIKVGSDFSGVGAFNQALNRLNIKYEEVFACDMDKFARQTFIHNYGKPNYYPENVYDREIPTEPLTIYMSSPPCQSFSMAGKRLGKEDKRGILFFNSHEFIKKNKPRYFIFENVKGLMSDDGGKTFSEWLNMLGGKSVNGLPVLFPYEESVPYHIYYSVLNARNYNIPQNRERIFIVGIRDDQDNHFRWAKKEYLKVTLKDILEEEVLKKYELSKEAIETIKKSQAKADIEIRDLPEYSKCLIAGYYKRPFDGQYIKIESNLDKYYLSEKMSKWVMETEFKEAQPVDIQRQIVAPCVKVGGDPTCFDVNKLNNPWIADYRNDEGLRIRKDNVSPCMTSSMRFHPQWNPKSGTSNPPIVGNESRIRRLTPRECFRLMDFPDSFTWPVSDSQAYKQAGNSIVVKCLEIIINQFNL